MGNEGLALVLIAGLSGSDFVGVASLVVTAVGFTVAVYQLRRTANATEATERAVERTEYRMALNHLLVLVPQFMIVESELDVSADENDRRLAIRALQSWTRVGSQAAGLLKSQLGQEVELIERIEASVREASAAKASLIDKPGTSTKSLTKDIRASLSDLASQFGTVVTQFTAQPVSTNGANS